MRESEKNDAPNVDPAGKPRGGLGGTDRSHSETEGGKPKDGPEDEAKRQRESKSDVEPRAGDEDGQVDGFSHHIGIRKDSSGLLERPPDHVAHQVDGYEVHEDRSDDLADPQTEPHDGRNQRPEGSRRPPPPEASSKSRSRRVGARRGAPPTPPATAPA